MLWSRMDSSRLPAFSSGRAATADSEIFPGNEPTPTREPEDISVDGSSEHSGLSVLGVSASNLVPSSASCFEPAGQNN